MLPDPVPVLTVEQVAERLQCAPDTVREAARELGGIKYGRDWVFPAAALNQRLTEKALAQAATPAPAPRPAAVVLRQVQPVGQQQRPGKRRTLPALPPA